MNVSTAPEASWIALTSASISSRPSRIAEANSGPASLPNTSLAILTALSKLPALFMLSTTARNAPAKSLTPAFAKLPIARCNEPMTCCALRPDLSSWLYNAILSSIEKPIARKAEPLFVMPEAIASIATPVFWEATSNLSSISPAREVDMLQLFMSLVTVLIFAPKSLFVIRDTLRNCTAIS